MSIRNFPNFSGEITLGIAEKILKFKMEVSDTVIESDKSQIIGRLGLRKREAGTHENIAVYPEFSAQGAGKDWE